MMSKDEIKFAIKALEECASIVDHQTIGCDAENAVANAYEAISLLKALAEQPARPYRLLQDNGSKYFGESWDKAEQPAQQEPVAIEYWLQDTMESGRWVTTDNMAKATAKKMLSGEYGDVYPQGRIVEPSPPASKPLTDEQIAEIAAQGHQRWLEFARAIEAAHGIKEST